MHFYRFGTALAVTAIAGGSALAQPPCGGIFGMMNKPLTVATTPAEALGKELKALQMLRTVGIPVQLQSDLALTETQRKCLTELAATVQKDRETKMKEIQEAIQNQGQDRERELAQEMRGNGGANPKALAILTAEQKAMVEKYIKDNPQPQGRRFGGN